MPVNTSPTQPPLPQPAPPLTLKARLMREAWHWAELPWRRFMGLVLPISVLIILDPPLPVVAYALWLWASLSWNWRARWSSIEVLARRGGVYVAFVLLVAVLSSAQVWIFPGLIGTFQTFWRAHLPGELSLNPFFPSSLMARTLLLLPLVPALARYYERVDPRTRAQEQRILTARDMQPKPPKAKPDAPQEPAKAAKPQPKVKPKPTVKAAPHEPAPERRRSSPEQVTIEGFLASDPAPARPTPPSGQTTKKPQESAPEAATPAPSPDPFKKKINWNDVAE